MGRDCVPNYKSPVTTVEILFQNGIQLVIDSHPIVYEVFTPWGILLKFLLLYTLSKASTLKKCIQTKQFIRRKKTFKTFSLNEDIIVKCSKSLQFISKTETQAQRKHRRCSDWLGKLSKLGRCQYLPSYWLMHS